MAEDIFATLLDVAGIKEYNTVQIVDGRSFIPLVTGRSSMDYNRPILTHFPHQWRPEVNNDIDYMTALRCGDWKIVYRHRTLTLELYNLAEDLSESNNLAQTNPEKLAELASLMTAELKAKGALMPTLRTTAETIPYPNQLIKHEED